MSNLAPQNYEYSIVDPTSLLDRDHVKLNRLYRESIENDFPGRTQAEYDYFVGQIDASRRSSNAGVGGALQRSGQRYSAPLTVVMQERETHSIVGVIATANNASSKRRFPLGRIEIESKLHVDRLMHKRWAWLGSRAFNEKLIGGISDTTEVSPVDIAIYFALGKRNPKQPVSSYPYDGERLWAQILNSCGIHDTGEEEEIKAFGGEAKPVFQRRHISATAEFADVTGVARVRELIAKKTGAPEAIKEAIVSEL